MDKVFHKMKQTDEEMVIMNKKKREVEDKPRKSNVEIEKGVS